MEIMEMPALPVAVMDRVAAAPTVEDVQAHIRQAVNALIAWVLTCKTLTFFAFETQLVPTVLALGRLFIQLFLSMREAQFQAAHSQPEPGYKRPGPQVRWLGTLVGKVHYSHLFLPERWRGLSSGCGTGIDRRRFSPGAAKLCDADRH